MHRNRISGLHFGTGKFEAGLENVWNITKDGRKFRAPKAPYSTNGQPEITPCEEGAVWCTNTKKIPLNSIVELSITSFNTFAAGNFYHLFHIHGMEFYVMATGHGEYPLTLNSAFRCAESKSYLIWPQMISINPQFDLNLTFIWPWYDSILI